VLAPIIFRRAAELDDFCHTSTISATLISAGELDRRRGVVGATGTN